MTGPIDNPTMLGKMFTDLFWRIEHRQEEIDRIVRIAEETFKDPKSDQAMDFMLEKWDRIDRALGESLIAVAKELVKSGALK